MDFTAFIVRNMKEYFDWIRQSRWSDITANQRTISFRHAHVFYRSQSFKDWPIIAGFFHKPFLESPNAKSSNVEIIERTSCFGCQQRFYISEYYRKNRIHHSRKTMKGKESIKSN